MKNKYLLFRKNKIIIFIIFVFIVTFFLSIFYVRFIKKLMYENVYYNISELSEQTSTQLNLSIENQMKFVDIVVDFINGGYPSEISQIFDRFNPDLDSYHFTRLVILDEAGNGITSDGYEVKNYPNIKEFFEQEEVYVSENRPSTVSDNQVNIYSKTFLFHNKKMVLFATINTEDYKEILSRRLFNGQGGTYLINQDGTTLIDSFSLLESDTNLFDYLKNANSKNEITKLNNMIKNISNKKNGTFDLTLDKKLHFIHYERLEVNNWYVVTIAPDSTIAKELGQFLFLSLGLCFFINFIMIIIFISIYISFEENNKKIYRTAYIDPITELGNEIYFKEMASLFLSKNTNIYVIILDINKFKTFNKLYSYQFCNEILKNFGKKVEEAIPENNITCRISRDIFASIFSYDGNLENLMSDLSLEISNLKVENVNINLNVSIGVYQVNKNELDINKILDKTYMAHSRVKGLYGSNYFFFDSSLENKVLKEQNIESRMEEALLNHEFKVVYQPKISVINETLVGAESLVRWDNGQEQIMPSEFIPLFEKNKFILKLDLYIFEQVCNDIVKWKEKYKSCPIISVNVSKEHFVDENFIDDYVAIVHKYGIDPSEIDLEITESATVDESIDILKVLKNIKNQGFIISIDDFGTGYSSLSLLQDMPIDIIKIDKSFIDSANLKSDKNIINYIVFITKKIGLKTIVEGVETKKQVDFIRNLKCDMIQGYYYSKPISKEDFEKYLENLRLEKNGLH